MPQTRLHITTDRIQAARIAQILHAEFDEDAIPVSSFEIDEDADIWSVSVYIELDDAKGCAERMRDALDRTGESVAIDIEPLEDRDWVAATLAALTPVRSGRFVVHGSHDRQAPRPHEHGLLIDAGLAFGTGHHGTTAGCLAMLDRLLRKRAFRRVLDLGTGSGVLAIAAARALPARVFATDIDPVAVGVARVNARLNGVGSRIEFAKAAGFAHSGFKRHRPFDLVLANILARPLEGLARDLVSHCAPGACVILSGLLPHQQARIVAAYRLQGLRLAHAHRQDGWLTLILEKPA